MNPGMTIGQRWLRLLLVVPLLAGALALGVPHPASAARQ
jgi:hypothetical protein